jgi:hypothetical protein
VTAQEQERAATTVPPPGASDRTSLVARVWNGSMRLLRSAPTTTINRDPLPAGVISRVLLLWGVGRAINLLILFGWYQISKAGKWGFGPEGELVTTFLNFLSDWDGARYGRISQVGYPTWLPLAPSGVVQPNDWAFLPVFPWLERVISDALGVPWQAAGVGISIIASAGATVMLYLLLHRVTTPKSAWWGVVLFTLSPLSFVFVLAYAESLILMLLFACLLLAVNRRYAWIAPVGVLAAYVRPGGLAIALTLGVVFLVTLPLVLRVLVLLHHAIASGLFGARPQEELRAELLAERRARGAAVSAEAGAVRRLERDIHDGPQQRLVRLQMDLAAAERRLDTDPASARSLLGEARAQAAETLDELRALSKGLMPPLLQDRGLVCHARDIWIQTFAARRPLRHPL